MKTKMSAKSIISDDGTEIFYWVDVKKKNHNTKFTFLHPGSSMNHTSLEPLEKLMEKEGAAIINIDPRGTGYSQTPNKKEYFSLDRYTNDIEKILEAEGIEKPDFIGHSSGFMPIVDYASKTGNADKIFGISASYHFPETAKNKILFQVFNNVLRYNELFGSAVTGLWHGMTKPAKNDNGSRPYNDQSKIYAGANEYIAIIDVPLKEALNHCISGKEINKWDITSQLRVLDNLVVVMYGNKDFATVPEKAGEKIIALSKNSQMIILPGSHDIPIKNPGLILEMIKRYY